MGTGMYRYTPRSYMYDRHWSETEVITVVETLKTTNLDISLGLQRLRIMHATTGTVYITLLNPEDWTRVEL